MNGNEWIERMPFELWQTIFKHHIGWPECVFIAHVCHSWLYHIQFLYHTITGAPKSATPMRCQLLHYLLTHGTSKQLEWLDAMHLLPDCEMYVIIFFLAHSIMMTNVYRLVSCT